MNPYKININLIEKETGLKLNGAYEKSYVFLDDNLYKNLIENDMNKNVIKLNQKQRIESYDDFINSEGYRSDNFKKNTKDDVLFLGCSQTFGLGIYLEDLWAKKVQQKIDPNINFNNLGLIGISIEEIVYNAFKYFNKYGNPGTIFFLLPNIVRGLNLGNELSITRCFQFYHLLEIYCELNSIKLISTTWDIFDKKNYDTNNLFSKYFNTFYKIDLEEYEKLVNDFINKNPNLPFLLKARDGIHMGTAQNSVIADFFVSRYLELNK